MSRLEGVALLNTGGQTSLETPPDGTHTSVTCAWRLMFFFSKDRRSTFKIVARIATLWLDHTHLGAVVSRIKRNLRAKDDSLLMQERANKGLRFHKMRRGCEICEAETACCHPYIHGDLILL